MCFMLLGGRISCLFIIFAFSSLALFAGPQFSDDPSQLQPSPFGDYRQYQ